MKPMQYVILFFVIMFAVYFAIMWNEKMQEQKMKMAAYQEYLASQQNGNGTDTTTNGSGA